VAILGLSMRHRAGGELALQDRRSAFVRCTYRMDADTTAATGTPRFVAEIATGAGTSSPRLPGGRRRNITLAAA
jgi:hypothetical protein